MTKFTVRNPCVAGQFYPADPNILQQTINNFFLAATDQSAANKDFISNSANIKALISPHAGYIYSGPIAAHAYSLLKNPAHKITKVVLFGPAHRCYVTGIAATNVDLFATPLGNIAVDKALINLALTNPNVKINEAAYHMEHCLEVQLPFLQTVLTDFTIAPFIVGDCNPEYLAELINTLWGGPENLFVISSDLSHYHAYATAQYLDQATSQAIQNLKPEDIGDEQACGRLPIKGLLLAAKKYNLKAKILDVRNSGDTAGNKDRVVGYGAYYFYA